MEELFNKIKRLREERNLNHVAISKEIGISNTAYSKIEKGITKSISLDIAIKIAKVLDVDFNELFGIEKPDYQDDLNGEIEILKKRIIELESQLEDKKRLEKYLSKDLLNIKPLILNWVEEFHLTEPDFIIEENPQIIKLSVHFKTLLSESIDKEAELLAACVKGGYFSVSDVENKFGNKEVFLELMSKYRKLL